MKTIILHLATAMLVVGYLIHAINFVLIRAPKMGIAMLLFAGAMYCLFTK